MMHSVAVAETAGSRPSDKSRGLLRLSVLGCFVKSICAELRGWMNQGFSLGSCLVASLEREQFLKHGFRVKASGMGLWVLNGKSQTKPVANRSTGIKFQTLNLKRWNGTLNFQPWTQIETLNAKCYVYPTWNLNRSPLCPRKGNPAARRPCQWAFNVWGSRWS